MGIANVCNMCSHLQNASRARLGLTSVPNQRYNLFFALALHRAGYISSVTRGSNKPPPLDSLSAYHPEPITTANVADSRLWVGLKYWDNKPVMSKLTPVSKPKRPVTLKVNDLEYVVRGFRRGYVEGLELGECLFISTDRGVMEAREALARNTAGLVLARVS